MKGNNKILKKLFSKGVFLPCFTISLLVLCIFIVVEVVASNKQNRPPRIFGVSVSYVPTQSMEPTIYAGEYVMFTKTNFEKVSVGDIVIFGNSDGIYIIHRVIEKYDDYLIAHGDNNPMDVVERVSPDKVYGKYVMTIGILSIFSGGISKELIYTILITIFVIMIIMQIISVVIKNKTEKIKKDSKQERELMLEELRKEILEEELEKLRKENNKKE